MKKTKVENISSIKLEFFLRQNKEDVRVALKPGECTWCDQDTTTKSMILYKRKSLIKVTAEASDIELLITEGLDVIPVKPMLAPNPSSQLFYIDFKYEDKPQVDGVILKESEKKYKGKKRGRKKKRGPKTGSKRKKGNSNSSDNQTDTETK